MRRRLWGVLLLSLGCQSYELRHISPVGVTVDSQQVTINSTRGTPRLMLVQDTSGSMCEPIAADVQLGSDGYCAQNVAQSKAGLVSANLQTVLSQLDPVNNKFNLGLLSFPNSVTNDAGTYDGCGVRTTPLFSVADAVGNIPKIEAWYGQMDSIIRGGTPTAASLESAAEDPALKATDGGPRYIILITDGLPNCNDRNPCVLSAGSNLWTDGLGHGCESESYEQWQAASLGEPPNAMPPAACQCSEGACQQPDSGTACCTEDVNTFIPGTGQYAAQIQGASRDCLDSLASVATIQQLYASGISTYVIGLGYDFAGQSGQQVLTQMAQAGAGGQADAGYFPAQDAGQLYAALNGLIGSLVIACDYQLNSPPSDPRLIEVQIDDDPYLQLGDPNGFSYDAATHSVDLLGTACALVKNGQHHALSIKAVGQ